MVRKLNRPTDQKWNLASEYPAVGQRRLLPFVISPLLPLPQTITDLIKHQVLNSQSICQITFKLKLLGGLSIFGTTVLIVLPYPRQLMVTQNNVVIMPHDKI